jgi:hypothetical protein
MTSAQTWSSRPLILLRAGQLPERADQVLILT